VLKNTITVLVQVDHITDINYYLKSISEILSQKLPDNINVDIVTLTTNLVHPDVQKIYLDVEEIKSRFEYWPKRFDLRTFISDDFSFQKIRNFTDNLSKGEFGELVTFKSVAPIQWYPNHLNCHWKEYKLNKKLGWMISRLEIKDISKFEDEKSNTFNYRLEDFPLHIDQMILDELFIRHDLIYDLDFNAAAIHQKNEDGTKVALFHIGKFVTEELIPKANEKKLEGFNPEEISLIQWLDLEAIRKSSEQQQQAKNPIDEEIKENEDGSISFISDVDENGAAIFIED